MQIYVYVCVCSYVSLCTCVKLQQKSIPKEYIVYSWRVLRDTIYEDFEVFYLTSKILSLNSFKLRTDTASYSLLSQFSN